MIPNVSGQTILGVNTCCEPQFKTAIARRESCGAGQLSRDKDGWFLAPKDSFISGFAQDPTPAGPDGKVSETTKDVYHGSITSKKLRACQIRTPQAAGESSKPSL